MEISSHKATSLPTPGSSRRKHEPPLDRLECGRDECPGTYGPSFPARADVVGAEAPSRTGLKAAGLALAVVAVAALCDALTGGAVHRSRD